MYKFLSVLILLSLTACGFHLRGNIELQPIFKSVFIKTSGSKTELIVRIKRALTDQGAVIVEQLEDATVQLNLGPENSGKRVLSVNAAAKVKEYELFTHFTYSATAVAGEFELPPRTITVTRGYQYDANNVLGKDSEEATIRREILDDVLRLVLVPFRER
ncbi:MAG: hypothetical protein JKY93_09465 [Gammaproteobacteria bacterium]|nr:hypothetical protein [Gammaproteobacteria bacterium]